jgi:hypothetical protein
MKDPAQRGNPRAIIAGLGARRPTPRGLARRSFAPPALVHLGDLRDVTLGGSVGRADSGAPTRQARVGGP